MIDGCELEKEWIKAGRDPKWLTGLLKKYPAAYYLSWIQSEIGKWYAEKMLKGDETNLKLLGPGLEDGKKDSGLRQLVTDFEIYRDAKRLCETKGYKLGDPHYDDSVFRKLQVLPKLRW